ncbi:ligase-associated DNA damage response endonuclease PdeM [Gemmatimonas sp.]|uniref:ligase-associated DNA damage response endonuclease PdeM n=1 Tax=Gemmatimonas sp. TaxID=1962908 RepID=UPI003DA3105B
MIPAGALEIVVAGEQVVLLPERALWLPAHATLLVADLHWGKAAAFRAAHIPVPMGTTSSDLARLSSALQVTAASHLVVLGDLLHARAGRHDETFRTIASWRATHADLRITLVRGNHDQHAGDPPVELNIGCTDKPLRLGAFVGVHEPMESLEGYVLCGHLHPSVTVRGRGRQSLRLPSFVFGPSRGVLPAFASFTGGGMYEQDRGDRLFGIAADSVVPLN